MSRSMTRDEIVEFSTFLYGPKWQSPLAEALGTERRALVRDIASEKPIPQQTAGIILSLIDQKIEQMQREYKSLLLRVEQLKREIAFEPPKRVTRVEGREIAS